MPTESFDTEKDEPFISWTNVTEKTGYSGVLLKGI